VRALSNEKISWVPRNFEILHLPRPSKSKRHLFVKKEKEEKRKPEGKGLSPEKSGTH